ncbi:transposase [Streptomyces sp. NPDC004044]
MRPGRCAGATATRCPGCRRACASTPPTTPTRTTASRTACSGAGTAPPSPSAATTTVPRTSCTPPLPSPPSRTAPSWRRSTRTWRFCPCCRASTWSTPLTPPRPGSPGPGVSTAGPIPTASGRTAPPDPAFVKSAFRADWDTHTLTCPAGHTSRPWQQLTLNQHPYLQATFRAATCRSSPQRPRCTSRADRSRSVTLQPTRELHEIQIGNWADQDTQQWKDRYAMRAGVEALNSQAVRALGLRRSRYRGLPKTRLHTVLTAAACNVVRVGAG